MAAIDSKYHIKIGDYGFLLARDVRLDRHIYGREEAPHFVNKFSSGNPNYRDSTFFPHFVQNNWLNGFNQEIFDDGAKFYRSSSVDITDQQKLTLSKKFSSAGQTASGVNVTCQEAWRASAASAFGDGGDGALTISTDTTDTPIDATCSGTSGSTSLSATNSSFAAGQKILIIQMAGTNAGKWQKTEIISYSTGTITTKDTLSYNYSSTGDNKAQVIVMKEYTSVTIDSAKTWTAKDWTGSVGGVLAFLCSGTVTVTGTISANGRGFRGGTSSHYQGYQGENTSGAQAEATAAAETGGGGGASDGGTNCGGGGGGGHSATATAGSASGGQSGGSAGASGGAANLNTTMIFGGAGGAGGGPGSGTAGAGGDSGGIIFIFSSTVTITGAIQANGVAGGNAVTAGGGGGGGSGGSILIKAGTATLGSSLVTATAGSGGTGAGGGGNGGAGATGRIHLDYATSFTGTTNPTLDSAIDSSLSSSPAGSGFTHMVGTSGGKIYSWDGASTYTELFNARRLTWYDDTSLQDQNASIGDSGGTEYAAAQSFQVTAAMKCKGIEAYLRKNAGTPGDITVRIETNNAGVPSGTLVNAAATATIPAFATLTYGWVAVEFSSNFALAASTTYHIVLKTAAAANDNNYVWGSDASSPSYTSGQYSQSTDGGATWSGVAGTDLLFRVNGNNTIVNCALNSGISGSTILYFGIGDFTSTDNGDARIISYNGTTFAINKIFASHICVNSMAEYGTTLKAYIGLGPTAEVYVTSDFSTFTLSKDISSPRGPGYVFDMAEYNGKLYVCGGYPQSLTSSNDQYLGFLYSYDEYSWLNVFPFAHTVLKSLYVYDTLLFIGTIKKRLYVYNTATLDKLFEFPWDVQIMDMTSWDDKLALALCPTPGSAASGYEGIYLFDRNGFHNAFNDSGRSWYSVFVFNNNLMGGNDNGYIFQTSNNTYQASGTLQTSYDEANLPSIDKLRRAITLIFDSLPTGCSIQVEYKTDEADSSWTNLGTASTVASTSATYNFSATVYSKKISFRITLATSVPASTPTLKKIIHKYVLSPDFKYLWKMKLVCADNIIWLDGTEPITETTAQIVSGATTIPVTSTTGFPSYGKARAGTDVFDYTGLTSTSFTGVTGITTTVASGSTVKITGADLHAKILELKQAKQLYTFTDIDGLTYTVLFHNYQADTWSVNQDDGLENEVPITLLEA